MKKNPEFFLFFLFSFFLHGSVPLILYIGWPKQKNQVSIEIHFETTGKIKKNNKAVARHKNDFIASDADKSNTNSDIISKVRARFLNSIEYPAAAREMGWQGKVQVEIYINEKGGLEKVDLKESSNYKIFDNAVLEAVSGWEFPFIKGPLHFPVTVNFRLENENE